MPEPETVWYTTNDVAALFGVDPKTVRDWVAKNLIPSVLTPGGHHRFREHQILAILHDGSTTGPQN